MVKKLCNILFLVFLVNEVNASSLQAAKIYVKSYGDTQKYFDIAEELVKDDIYFAAIPFIKDYLLYRKSGGDSKRIDAVIDKIVSEVGIKQFELLPIKILRRSNSPMLRYIRAKKLFRAGKYDEAIASISQKNIPTYHSVKPFTLLLEGSILTIQRKYNQAQLAYDECIARSNSHLSKELTKNQRKQLEINRDYCILGKPRNLFSKEKYEEANLAFLDLPKNSYVWPEILFEEAWNSFYLKNYNRTLGKLVTYEAPVLNHVFNPEISVLKSLSYLELCLYDDAKKEVDIFYERYQKESKVLRAFLKKYRTDFKFYYQLARDANNGNFRGTPLLKKIINSIIYDPTFNEMLDNFIKGKNEIITLESKNLGKFKNIVMRNVKDALIFQRDLVGRHVRKMILINYGKLFKAFEGMSYIKLEVLARKKRQIYQSAQFDQNRKRGDIEYLKRNQKQYFWSFNGEFWADELGDYVFALASECSK